MSPELLRLIGGFQASQAIHTAAELGVPDLLANGARTVDDLAEATNTHSPTLYRLLRALAAVGILSETEGRRFSLTPFGEPLRSDVPGSLRDWARLIGREHLWRSWGNLSHSVRTGENAFRSLHGTDVWEWRSTRPEESALFDAAMRSLTGTANAAIVAAYDWGRFGTIVDVGGGTGTLLAALLEASPKSRGVLLDQEHVVSGAEPVLRDAGVLDRCDVVAGSFFSAVPEGGDAYVLKSIIHDWEDEHAVAILRTCATAMKPGAALLVIERDLGPPNENAAAKFSDLNMLVMPGGRERSQEEYDELLAQAGLRTAGTTVAATGHAIIEAVPA